MKKSISLYFLIWITAVFSQDQWKVDGHYPLNEPISKTTFWLSRYLPYNPKIIILSEQDDCEGEYSVAWPLANFCYLDPLKQHAHYESDLIWVKADGSELSFLEKFPHLLKNTKAIYTSTHFFHRGAYYQKLKQFVESFGFTLLFHWYQENKEGVAIFIKNDLLQAEKNALSSNPDPNQLQKADPLPPLSIEPFLHPVVNKGSNHKMDGIDFIYMINLDERPEKFLDASSELAPYGIYPYRFSAVNGWKLSGQTIEKIGLSFSSSMLSEPFLGSCFKEINGKVYRSNEIISATGKTYYPPGMALGSIGIILSHLSILKDAFDSGYETIWILEDDIEALEDPRQLSTLIQRLDRLTNSWDILFTDTDTKAIDGTHVPCRALAKRPAIDEKPLSYFFEQFYSLSPDFSRTGMRYGTYSMILRRSGIEKILRFYEKYHVFLPYDMDFWMTGEMNMYCTTRDLVSHKNNSLSDNGSPTYESKKP
jgi:GR25 family glycosyltransferase involved in LPS biosynthesis